MSTPVLSLVQEPNTHVGVAAGTVSVRRWTVVAVLVGLVCLAALGAVRFAKHSGEQTTDTAVYVAPNGTVYSGLAADHLEYFRAVDGFAGRGVQPQVGPFTQRWLVPKLASLVPLEAPLALNAVNFLLLAAGLGATVAVTRRWVRNGWVLTATALAYSLSFPVLWYSTSNWIDGATVGLVALSCWAGYRKWFVGAAIAAVAVLAKESALVLVPFGVALEMTRLGSLPRRVRVTRAATWVAAGLGGLWVAARLGGETAMTFAPWVPGDLDVISGVVARNLANPNGLSFVVATAALPAAGLLWARRSLRTAKVALPRDRVTPMLAGSVAAAALSVWSLLGAYWDGRMVWYAYPFALPLIAACADQWLRRGGGWTPAARRKVVSALSGAAVTTALVVAVALVAVAPLGAVMAGPSHSGEPGEQRFADRLATLPPLISDAWFSGTGTQNWILEDADVQSGAPLLLDYRETDGRRLAIRLMDAAGRVVAPLTIRPVGGSGTVLVDPPPGAAVVNIDSTGECALRARPVNTAFMWDQNSVLSGDGDTVVVIPGGSTVLANLELRTDDDSAGIGVVGAQPFDGIIRPARTMPAGTEAVVIRSDAPWTLVPSNRVEDR